MISVGRLFPVTERVIGAKVQLTTEKRASYVRK
jgi:hypothetical protein